MEYCTTMLGNGNTRPAAVAGLFYPADPVELRLTIERLLSAVTPTSIEPKAIIVPHAGYLYSGPIAATACAHLLPLRGRIERVVLIGPAHRVPVQGLAAPSADQFATPLGLVDVDRPGVDAVLALPHVSTSDDAHRAEHSLEVHLPFLQAVLGRFSIVPLVVGEATDAMVADALRVLWGGPETLIVISSDLSHFHNAATARRLDDETCRMIVDQRPELLTSSRACGFKAIAGLIDVARRDRLHVTTVDLRTSADTAGSPDRVVGYGAWLVG